MTSDRESYLFIIQQILLEKRLHIEYGGSSKDEKIQTVFDIHEKFIEQ